MNKMLPKIPLRTLKAQRGIILALKRQRMGGKLALNAQTMLSPGIQRQKQAIIWR